MLRNNFSYDILTLYILLCMVLVVISKQLFAIRFGYYIELLWNIRYLKFYSKNRKGIDVFNILLLINMLISLSITIYFGFNLFAESNMLKINTLPYLMIFIGGFIALKSGIERFVAQIFNIQKMVTLYLFQKLTYNNYVGLVLIIINILLLYTKFDKSLLIFLSLGLFVSINIMGFLRILKLYQKQLVTNFFYFLLYLCALEIGPYVILYKAIKDYFV